MRSASQTKLSTIMGRSSQRSIRTSVRQRFPLCCGLFAADFCCGLIRDPSSVVGRRSCEGARTVPESGQLPMCRVAAHLSARQYLPSIHPLTPELIGDLYEVVPRSCVHMDRSILAGDCCADRCPGSE